MQATLGYDATEECTADEWGHQGYYTAQDGYPQPWWPSNEEAHGYQATYDEWNGWYPEADEWAEENAAQALLQETDGTTLMAAGSSGGSWEELCVLQNAFMVQWDHGIRKVEVEKRILSRKRFLENVGHNVPFEPD